MEHAPDRAVHAAARRASASTGSHCCSRRGEASKPNRPWKPATGASMGWVSSARIPACSATKRLRRIASFNSPAPRPWPFPVGCDPAQRACRSGRPQGWNRPRLAPPGTSRRFWPKPFPGAWRAWHAGRAGRSGRQRARGWQPLASVPRQGWSQG